MPKLRRKSRRRSLSRSNPMKGWKKSAPKPGRQRSAMRRRCGTKCFLKPATNGFPVCAHKTCMHSCKGLLAAKTRARQYKYPDVARKAQSLAKKKGCRWAKGSRRKSRRRKSRRKSRKRSRRKSRKRSRKSRKRSRKSRKRSRKSRRLSRRRKSRRKSSRRSRRRSRRR